MASFHPVIEVSGNIRVSLRTGWAAHCRCALLVLCCMAVVACSRTGAPGGVAAERIKAGTYRVVLQLPGGELPFGLDLEHQGPGWTGFLINGPERLEVSEVAVEGSRLDMKMPGYENRLTAEALNGTLEGEVVLNKLGGKDQHLPLHARLEQNYRFFPPPSTASIDVSGRWSVTFFDNDGKPKRRWASFPKCMTS